MRQLLRFSCLIAVMHFGLGSFTAWAGVIAKSGTQIEYIDALEHDATILRLNPTNAHGISLNYFSEFKVDDAYQILNTSRTLQDGSVQPAASLIVVVSNRIDLFTDLELVGIPADLLLITTSSSGVINCQSCNIKGFKRVVMAGASPTSSLAANSLQIGDLKSSSSSTITLSSMNVSGANSVTALANNVTTSGTINLHDKASKNSDGQFQSNPSGSYTMGVAELQLLVGPITWNHEKSMVQSVNVTTNSCYAKNSSTNFCYSPHTISSRTINGKIIAGAVKITAAAELNLNASIDTRSDALVFTAYAGGVMTLEEGITVQTFANGKANIKSSLYSDGVIRLRSTDDLNILSSLLRIEGQNIELFAGDQLTNRAQITGDNVAIASMGELLNEGKVKANGELVASSDYGLSNQYGGLLSGQSVVLNSKSGVIRNGSRTPYISSEAERSGFLSLQGTQFNEFPLTNATTDLGGSDYIYAQDLTKSGTYYSLNQTISSDARKAVAPDNSAHITAGKLTVVSKALENINPYYETSDGLESIEFNNEYLHQVTVTAEESIEIKADFYFVNSSAAIKLNSLDGIFKVDTAQLNNERYRGVSILDFTELALVASETRGSGDTLIVEQTFAEDTFITRTVISSPPANILSFSLFELNAQSAFINKMGYFEIYNTANIDSKAIYDIGFSNGGYGTTTITETFVSKEFCDDYQSGCVSQSRYENQGYQVSSELDSLFYVSGDLLAPSSAFVASNFSSFDGFIQQAIFDLISDEYSELGTRRSSSSTVGSSGQENLGTRVTLAYAENTQAIALAANASMYESFQEITESGVITINWSEDYTRTTVNLSNGDRHSVEVTETGTDEFSLVEVLTSYFSKIKDTFVEFYEEIKWWG